MRAVLIGATYTGNKGAAAMLIASVDRLREMLPDDAEFHVLSLYGESPGTAARRGVKIVRLPVLQLLVVLPSLALLHRLLGWIRPIGRMLEKYPPLESLAGADAMLDLSGISFVDGRGATLLYNICCLLPALFRGVPVFKMSQALGPFENFLNRRSARFLLPKVRHIFSRGRKTSQNLESLGLANSSRSADLAFLLGDAPAEQGVKTPNGAEADGPVVIGVAPSQVLMDHCRKVGVDYIGAMATAIDAVANAHGARVVIIAHSNLGEAVRSRNNDHHVCRSLYDACSCPDRSLVVGDLTPEELRGVIAGCDVFVASRFHAMISALCVGVPVLVTSWSHKYREVMEEFECGDRVLASGEITGTDLRRNMDLLIRDRRSVAELIGKHLPDARSSAMVQIAGVAGFLRERLAESRSAGVSKKAIELHARFYPGLFRRGILGHSTDRPLLSVCASGGLVTTLLSERMDRGLSDGAIVAGIGFDGEGRPAPRTVVARSPEELLRCAGSVYSDFSHADLVMETLREQEGVFDVVALPCQLSRIRTVLAGEERMKGRTGLLLGLWCGHATGPELLETLLDRWGVHAEDVEEFRYRVGHWRGRTRMVLGDGSVRERSFSKGYGLYQNMYADCAKRCFSCPDHFAEAADASFGDCWIGEEKKAELKKTMSVSITEAGDEALDMILSSPRCEVVEVDPVLAIEAQKRSVVWHTYSRGARGRLGGFFRVSVGRDPELSPRWNDFVSAFLTLLYYRMFGSGFRRLLFRLPWWMLFPAMAFQKLMLNR